MSQKREAIERIIRAQCPHASDRRIAELVQDWLDEDEREGIVDEEEPEGSPPLSTDGFPE